MRPQARRCFILGGSLSIAVALLHMAIILAGPPAYRYFGAGNEMADMAAAGQAWPAVLTSFITLAFAVWGLYAFSGAGLIRRLPFLRLGLVLIASIFILRGLGVLPQLYWLLTSSRPVEVRHIVFSLVSLTVGVFYALGAILSWKDLKKATN